MVEVERSRMLEPRMVVLGNCSCIALSPESIQSLVKINNARDDPLSPCPKGAKLENQFSVAAIDKGITIIFVLRLALIS
jgi:hypothetical protein